MNSSLVIHKNEYQGNVKQDYGLLNDSFIIAKHFQCLPKLINF